MWTGILKPAEPHSPWDACFLDVFVFWVFYCSPFVYFRYLHQIQLARHCFGLFSRCNVVFSLLMALIKMRTDGMALCQASRAFWHRRRLIWQRASLITTKTGTIVWRHITRTVLSQAFRTQRIKINDIVFTRDVVSDKTWNYSHS